MRLLSSPHRTVASTRFAYPQLFLLQASRSFIRDSSVHAPCAARILRSCTLGATGKGVGSARMYYGLSANRRKLGSMGRHELTDTQWHQLPPLLPPQKPRLGRPGQPHRRIINGILWILATGAPWRDLPPQYGSPHTVPHPLSHLPRRRVLPTI